MILRTLRTSSVAAIVERLHPLLHLDPVVFLPPELTFQIFSYLNTRSLLVASATSRAWRARALDPRLWRRLYTDEGWAAEFREVRRFEAERPSLPTSTSDPDRKARMARTAADGSGEEQQRSKRGFPRTGFITTVTVKVHLVPRARRFRMALSAGLGGGNSMTESKRMRLQWAR